MMKEIESMFKEINEKIQYIQNIYSNNKAFLINIESYKNNVVLLEKKINNCDEQMNDIDVNKDNEMVNEILFEYEGYVDELNYYNNNIKIEKQKILHNANRILIEIEYIRNFTTNFIEIYTKYNKKTNRRLLLGKYFDVYYNFDEYKKEISLIIQESKIMKINIKNYLKNILKPDIDKVNLIESSKNNPIFDEFDKFQTNLVYLEKYHNEYKYKIEELINFQPKVNQHIIEMLYRGRLTYQLIYNQLINLGFKKYNISDIRAIRDLIIRSFCDELFDI